MTIFEDASFWFDVLWAIRYRMTGPVDEMPPLEFTIDGGETIQLHMSYKKEFRQRCDDTYVREVRYRVGNIFVFDVDFIVDRSGTFEDEHKFWNTQLIPNHGYTEEDCEHIMVCFMLQVDKLLPDRDR